MWYQSFIGGIILAIATSLNLLLTGRLTGMSGLIKGLFSSQLD